MTLEEDFRNLENKYKAAMFEIEKRFLDIISRIEQLEGKMAVLESNITPELLGHAKEEDLELLKNRVTSLDAEFSERMDLLEKMFDEKAKAMATAVDSKLHEKFASVGEEMGRIKAISERAGAYTDNLREAVMDINAYINDISERLSILEQKINTIQRHVIALKISEPVVLE